MFIEFVQEQVFLFVALAVVVIMLAASYFGDKVSGYQSVSADEAVRLYNQDAQLLDVRSEAEYKTGFIGEASNVPVSELGSKLDKLSLDKDRDVLVYCQSGSRSASASKLLVKNGFTRVHNLSGGIMAWKNASLPVNKAVSKKKQRKELQGA